jgi:hypothetical protein
MKKDVNQSKHKEKGLNLKDYWPLICLILVAALASCAVNYGIQGEPLDWMHYFMGFLFTQFALLKLFDISGFADGFQMYDLIAKKSRIYALSYPFIEFGLGLAYLSFVFPIAIYVITIILMTIGSIGVFITLQKGLDLYCSCMGNILKVPLSTVTLTEDIGMGLMALFMLISLMA